MPKEATQIKYLTREEACAQLGMKERRLRDYVNAGKIRLQDGLLHAGDVARLQEERGGKKANAQLRALSTVAEVPPSGAPTATQVALARSVALARTGLEVHQQSGNPAIATLPLNPDRAWLSLSESEGYTGLPESFLRDLIDQGKLPACNVGVRPGGRYRVKRSDLDAIQAERR